MIEFYKEGKDYILKAEQRFPKPLKELFSFFESPKNLGTITPDFLGFKILNADPIEMKKGLLINYRISLNGIPVKWQSEITAYDPPHRFVDEQRKGPYKYWIHEHTFTEDGNVTIASDLVKYGVLGGDIIHSIFVKPKLRTIFNYRKEKLETLFGKL